MAFLDLLNGDCNESCAFADLLNNQELKSVKEINENEVIQYANCVKHYHEIEIYLLKVFNSKCKNISLELLSYAINIKNKLENRSSEDCNQKFLDFITEKFNNRIKK